MTQEALKLALDALESADQIDSDMQEAITAIKQALAQPEQDIAALVTGMEVSIDVSTGDHDSGHRLFGVVDLVQENQGSKHDLILLVQEPKANFKEALAQPEQKPVATLYGSLPVYDTAQPEQEPEAWMYQEYRDDDQFGWRDEILFTPPPNDPNYFRNIVPVYTASPQRTWVGLTDEEIDYIYTGIRAVHHDVDSDVLYRAIEAKLKEKNCV